MFWSEVRRCWESVTTPILSWFKSQSSLPVQQDADFLIQVQKKGRETQTSPYKCRSNIDLLWKFVSWRAPPERPTNRLPVLVVDLVYPPQSPPRDSTSESGPREQSELVSTPADLIPKKTDQVVPPHRVISYFPFCSQELQADLIFMCHMHRSSVHRAIDCFLSPSTKTKFSLSAACVQNTAIITVHSVLTEL